MMLKENSGMPPPRISSSPRTPLGSFWIVTLIGWRLAFPGSPGTLDLLFIFIFGSVFIFAAAAILLCVAKIQIVQGNFRPDLADQAQRQINADEGHQ